MQTDRASERESNRKRGLSFLAGLSLASVEFAFAFRAYINTHTSAGWLAGWLLLRASLLCESAAGLRRLAAALLTLCVGSHWGWRLTVR